MKYPMPIVRRSLAAPFMLGVWLLCACGGPQAVEGGEEILTSGAPSMMGEREATALAFIEDMTLVLSSNVDDPGAAVERMRAFLTVNQDAMLANAEAIGAHLSTLDASAARTYEAQLGAYLADAHAAWRQVRDTFRDAHPDAARELEGLIARVDA